MTDQEYLIRLSQKESYTTYLIRLRSHRDLTPEPVMEILPELNWHERTDTLLVVFGDKQSWDGLSVSLLIYL